jgi:serine/threonine protein kinase/biopolymer transport protein ExbD/capsular polysaccharide biosynthesis protein
MDTIPGEAAMQNTPHPPLAGLDPAALLKQGAAEDTLMEDSPPSHLPPIEELAALFPQFEILELIGQGGMGAVYKVRQKELDRIVALKILPPAIGETAGFAERFAREAKALARLNHPGIVTIHEFGKTSSSHLPALHSQPLYFILMEFVDGVNIAQLMKADRISPREALAIVPQICDALQFAHDQGIVHRDIKPENILLDRLGRVKVADFGIAKVVGNATSGDDVPNGEGRRSQGGETLGEKIVGTPQYMAPEQMDRPGDVDHRADIYALGVVFYQMLTGELPGKDLQAPSRKVHIDVRLDEMVLRALDRDPERRYQTAHEFRTVLDDLPQATPPPTYVPLPSPKRGMIPRWWWMFLVMLLVGPMIGFGVGSSVVHFIPKKYETEAVVEPKPGDGQPVTSQFLGAEFEKIKSAAALTAVADELDLAEKWGLPRSAVAGILKGIVRTENIRGTDLISVRIRHSDKKDAVAITRAVAKTYQRNSGAIIHQDPLEPIFPVSPNVPFLLTIGTAGGLLLSPLMALLVMPLLQRIFRDKQKHASVGKSSPVWVVVTLLLVMTAVVLGVGGSVLSYLTIRREVVAPAEVEARGASFPQSTENEQVSDGLANQYLDLVLELAVAEAAGLGDPGANRIARRNKLGRFNAAYPGMPDMPDARCRELASQRLLGLQDRMKALTDGGLGEKHPNYATLKVQADALTEVIGENERVSEPDGKADNGAGREAEIAAKFHFSSNGETTLNGEVITRESLQGELEALLQKSKDVKVFISSDPAVPYAKVLEMIDICQKSGIWNLSFAKDEKGKLDTLAEWLGEMDAGNYAECYSASTDAVKKVVAEEKWKEAMVLFRKPLGGVVSRKMIKSEGMKELPGMPDGEHRLMQFATEFANKKSAVETVIFTKENDGVWKNSGYFIR